MRPRGLLGHFYAIDLLGHFYAIGQQVRKAKDVQGSAASQTTQTTLAAAGTRLHKSG